MTNLSTHPHAIETPCKNCGLRVGTVQWVGEGGMLAITHGWYEMWCQVCVLEAQLAYAKQQALEVERLEGELAVARAVAARASV